MTRRPLEVIDAEINLILKQTPKKHFEFKPGWKIMEETLAFNNYTIEEYLEFLYPGKLHYFKDTIKNAKQN